MELTSKQRAQLRGLANTIDTIIHVGKDGIGENLIKQADDGREDSKHAGAFMPRTIEVKNYRSYTEAAFDFSPVHMAMVNGQNGVGKSSLFMDAIADCLYEQTRKEDIGGWVRDGTPRAGPSPSPSAWGQRPIASSAQEPRAGAAPWPSSGGTRRGTPGQMRATLP